MSTSFEESTNNQDSENYGPIYIKQLNQWVPVSKEVYKWHKTDIQVFLRRMQRKGLCSCTAGNWWKCDKDCYCCNFCLGSEFIPIESTYGDSSYENLTIATNVPCEDPTPQEIIEDHEIISRLHDAMTKLPSKQREICVLWSQGLSEEQIACQLNYNSRNSVFQHLQRAKDNLRSYLSDCL